MDNQIFPTGAYLDDLPQMCTLCGMLLSNAMSLQHHMQLHILTAATANQLLGSQSADSGLGLAAAPSILDLVAGTSQHMVQAAGTQLVVTSAAGAQHVVVAGSSSNNHGLIPAQALYTANSVTSIPSHFIPQSIGHTSSRSTSLPQKSRERKSKTTSSKVATALNLSTSSSITSSTSARNSVPSSSRSKVTRALHQSRETPCSTYISTYPADLQNIDLSPPGKPTSHMSSSKDDLDPFPLPSLDPIEEALTVPSFSKVSQIDRSRSSKVKSSSQNKDANKLFQPFVTVDEPTTLSFMSKSSGNTIFTADSLLSPVKTCPVDKSIDLDVLSTPQKPSYSSLQDNDSRSSSSPKPLPSVPINSDLRHFARGKNLDSVDFNQFGEKVKDKASVKVSQGAVDNISTKPQFYAGLVDPLNISPKSSQLFRDNKNVNGPAKVFSSSPELKTSISIANEPPGVSKDPTVPMLSPKLSTDITNTSVATSIVSVASKPPSVYGSGDDIHAGISPGIGTSKAGPQVSVASVLMNPAVGLTDVTNPLGTGYFNALTQKLFNPGLPIGTDFNKPNTSSFNYGNDTQGQKGKSYYENGILINQDYDKISDSGGEEDLEKLIDDIDTKDNIDSKGYTACSEIEDLLNEFNEKHPEDLSKNKTQMDDFLNDVLNENIRLKLDEKPEDPVPSVEDMVFNHLAISELLEKEKEKIDEESKMLESARLNASVGMSEDSLLEFADITYTESSTTATTTTVTTTSATTTSTSRVHHTEPSTSAAKPDAKEDDPADFDIPKVGKLMKIRKYFQIQEQKKKENTQRDKEAEAEVKIQIREKEPIPKQIPQTILVQVSKRKKIEYGPYINRQSLLEGKPKDQPEQEVIPPKVFRPKPKPPQVPTRRTFNLRARKTKTDFASLVKGSKTTEAKKTPEKAKDEEQSKDTAPTEEPKEEEMKTPTEETESVETGITTRNKDKVNKVPESGQIQVCKVTRKGKDNQATLEPEKDSKKEDGKPNLRTRTNKAENDESVTDTKTTRKRTSKSPADSSKAKVIKPDTNCTKADNEEKVVKTEEQTKKFNLRNKDSKETKDIKETKDRKEIKDRKETKDIKEIKIKEMKDSNEAKDSNESKDSKETKEIKEVKKKSPEKAGIKMCSVNLGENLTESKIKAATSTCVLNLRKCLFKQAADKVEEKKQSSDTVEKHSVEETCITVHNELDKTGLKFSVDDFLEQTDEQCVIEKDKKGEIENRSNRKEFELSKNGEVASNNVQESNTHASITTKSETTYTSVSNKESKIAKPESGDKNRDIVICEIVHDKVTQQEPVREKLTMKFKLGANLASIMKYTPPKVKKRKLSKSPKVRREKGEVKVAKEPKENDEKGGVDVSRAAHVKKSRVDESTVVLDEKSRVDESTVVRDNKCRVDETTVVHDETHKVDESTGGVVKKCRVDESREACVEKLKVDENREACVEKLEVDENTVARVEKLKVDENTVARVEKRRADESTIAHDSPDGSAFEPPVKREKKLKHSVENEFQRLVDEAMAEVKNAQNNDSGKKERISLRKRQNEGVKYNVDDSDEEIEPRPMIFVPFTDKSLMKTGKSALKPLKMPVKGASKLANKSPLVDLKPKKDMDIYDFTDTEEETTPSKLSFKPKYVSNLNLFGQNKLPFVSTSPSTGKSDTENRVEFEDQNETEEDKVDTENEHSSYVGLSVEPLKLKLSKIIPYKEKKHKHKKKKRKRDKERKHHHERNENEKESLGNEMESKCDENNPIEIIDEDSDSNEGQDGDPDDNTATRNSKKPKLKEKKHICVFCNQGFGQKCDLRKHVMIHTGERPWPCETCDKRFQRKTDLVKHTRTHTGEKPYACEFCDKRVSDKSQLSVHRRLHTGDRPYQCTKCGKRCITSSELTRHRSVRCSEKPHTCELCKKTFKIKECLGMHMKMHYRSKGKLFQCDKCAIGFDKKGDMDNHSCANWNNSLYMCSECYEEFSDELVYAEHIKTHDLGVFSCNMCTNIFEDKHSLETHLCSSGLEKQRFQCGICDEIFQDQNSLSQHDQVHDNDTGPFMCDLCPEIFSLRKDLTLHVRRHKDVNHQLSESSRSGESVLKGDRPDFIDVDNPDDCVKLERYVGERASVISNTFRQVQSGHTLLQRRELRDSAARKGYHNAGPGNGLRENIMKTNGRQTQIKSNVLHGDKIFEASDFTNSPDFSSLTEDPDLSMDPFESVSEIHNVNRRVNSSFGGAENQRENIGFLGSLEHSIKEEQTNGKSFPSVTSGLHSPPDSAQDFSWTGSYQISANEYVDSLLNKMGPSQSGMTLPDLPTKSSAVKEENHDAGSCKTTGILSPSSRGDIYKDNIENRSKSDFFSEFDFQIGQKPDSFQGSVQPKSLSQQKFINSGARENTAFQGIDQNSYNLSRSRNLPESSPFANSFMASFQQNNSIYNSGNTNFFGAASSDIIHKRGSSSGVFGGNPDMMQSNFYLGVEESLKGTSPNDKTDETTALLSNFDYGIN